MLSLEMNYVERQACLGLIHTYTHAHAIDK